MDKNKIFSLIENIEILISTLKDELNNTENDEDLTEDVDINQIQIDDYDEIFYDFED